VNRHAVASIQDGRFGTRGQSLVEFAIALPIFLVLTIGLFDFGRVVWTNNVLANATREGARYAIVRGGSPTTRCPVGPPATTAVIPPASASCPYPSPLKQGIVGATLDQAVGAGGTVVVTVCYGNGCSGNTDISGATNARNTAVTVGASTTVQLVSAALLGISQVPLSSQTTMIVSH
jgi:Flp pilus assembly protein TadG